MNELNSGKANVNTTNKLNSQDVSMKTVWMNQKEVNASIVNIPKFLMLLNRQLCGLACSASNHSETACSHQNWPW